MPNIDLSLTPSRPKLFVTKPGSSHQPVHFSVKAAKALLLKGQLPPYAIIDGSISFDPGSEPVFPMGVHILGSLSVAWCGDAVKLGPCMTIDGLADLSMTSISAIPAQFHVKMALDVSHTFISDFPQDMRVDWKIVVGGNVTKSMRAQVEAVALKHAENQHLSPCANRL
jgi:hypothetical protein